MRPREDEKETSEVPHCSRCANGCGRTANRPTDVPGRPGEKVFLCQPCAEEAFAIRVALREECRRNGLVSSSVDNYTECPNDPGWLCRFDERDVCVSCGGRRCMCGKRRNT